MVLALAGDSTITTFIQGASFGGRRCGSAPPPSGAGYGEPKPACQIRADGSSARSGRALDVCVREIVAFVKQRSAGNLGLGVDEAVPEVEPRRMSFSLAIASEGFERDMGGFRLDRLNGDACGSQEVPTCVSARPRGGSESGAWWRG